MNNLCSAGVVYYIDFNCIACLIACEQVIDVLVKKNIAVRFFFFFWLLLVLLMYLN